MTERNSSNDMYGSLTPSLDAIYKKIVIYRSPLPSQISCERERSNKVFITQAIKNITGLSSNRVNNKLMRIFITQLRYNIKKRYGIRMRRSNLKRKTLMEELQRFGIYDDIEKIRYKTHDMWVAYPKTIFSLVKEFDSEEIKNAKREYYIIKGMNLRKE